jgi:hypothetical protein
MITFDEVIGNVAHAGKLQGIRMGILGRKISHYFRQLDPSARRVHERTDNC